MRPPNHVHIRRHHDVYYRDAWSEFSEEYVLLVVVHCYRAEGKVIRIISARKADTQERSAYQR